METKYVRKSERKRPNAPYLCIHCFYHQGLVQQAHLRSPQYQGVHSDPNPFVMRFLKVVLVVMDKLLAVVMCQQDLASLIVS